jgi:glucosamine-6-phosphate deaminase
MEVIILPDAESVGCLAARIVARVLRERPQPVLGFATGSTPLPLYRELIRMYRAGEIDFSRATSFNLDEYVGLPPDHPQSYRQFMQNNLFAHINIDPSRVHIPDGNAADIPAECARYEQLIAACGGIDLQILGIGVDGHIGFNEPTSSLRSRTRIKTLTERTRRDNARFFGSQEAVPHHVITMGIGTILDCRSCLMLATGAAKAEAVARMVEGPLTAMCPASALQLHPSVKVLLDEPAAAKLAHAAYYRWIYEQKPEWQRD